MGAVLFFASTQIASAQTRTIAILGASTAAGTGATSYDSAFAGRYAHYLQSLNPAWKLVNLSVSGYTTYQVMPTGYQPPAGRPTPDTAHNITKVLALKPQALLICLPSNDIDQGFPAAEYNANFDSLRTWGLRANIPVWITTPLPRSALDAAKRQLLLTLRDRILSRYAPRAINFYDSLGDAAGNYYTAFNFGDGVHTNNHGHRILYERLVAADLPVQSATLIWARGGFGDSDGSVSPDRSNATFSRVTYGLPRLFADTRSGMLAVSMGRVPTVFDMQGRYRAPIGPNSGWSNR